MLPTITITFDEHKETALTAFGIMAAHGLVGTYFVTPSTIDTANGPSLNTLLAMDQNDWEIGAYSGDNMVSLNASNRILANNKLRDLKNQMWAFGIPVVSLAAAQRAWNGLCADLANGMYENVRVADHYTFETIPPANRFWVANGGTASFSSIDTIASLSSQVDTLITAGPDYWWIPIIHRVSDDGLYPDYTVTTTVFNGFCAKVAAEVAAGNIRCVRFMDAF